jgi:site-specific recombinase XerD
MVFTPTIGTLLEARNINRQSVEFVKQAGLPPIRSNDLRHTCATLLLVQGIPARVVLGLLGHSTICQGWTGTGGLACTEV